MILYTERGEKIVFNLMGKDKKNKKATDSKKIQSPINTLSGTTTNFPSVQAWLPFYDVNNNFIWLRQNKLVTAISIEPVNLDLYSTVEEKRIIHSLFEVVNSLDVHWIIHSQQRPVNLDAYITSQEEMRDQETNFTRRRILDSSIRNASKIASSGESIDVFYYLILFSQLIEKQHRLNAEELAAKATEISLNLSASVQESHVCDDQELRDILFSFLNPSQSSYERAPAHSWEQLPPQLAGGI